jgi:carbon monoxide dehydrogenase subunit G
VLLEVSRVSDVGAAPPVAWSFIRDVERLTGCIPNVSDLRTLDPDRRYSAVVSDQLGPFKLSVPVEIELEAIDEPHSISAAVTGTDRRGQARINGTLGANIQPFEAGTRIALTMRMEVLGKLATLGAAPMRRRADDIFSKFAACLTSELA